MTVRGAIRPPKESERYFALLRVETVNGEIPEAPRPGQLRGPHAAAPRGAVRAGDRGRAAIETRIVDLVAPIGKGQRALIVAPPRTGKTVLLQKMTQAITKNYPRPKVIVLLSTSARKR
jgi:transcription termination factor Rho